MSKKICIVHAPDDLKAATALKMHAAMMRRNGLIEITDEVGEAEIVIVMTSNAMVSDEPTWARSEAAKRRHAAGNCRLIPIMVGHLDEMPDHLALLTALPRHGRPATTDADWAGIAGEIRTLALR